ncbi:hypothetical protein HanRHA438_Chr10g0446271 [Helianthus annuus]|uniref:F-box domain-containing protein n=1 Tax=Helianthus annuus TaxID=4232 RepID=A0A251TJ39_HELAN|nr:hypothetical protein HanXRQr2_Chr10g0434051 [Helianthus annuus]KAJ0521184.1 hypothetical protein HanIR_Chr10g0467991 [Helianthus annuus]KAJ0529481.1 hypothetical protein HanHA89_Chr10g0378411 [Helianthus annuus]KAJ0878992.1 hypothetical protein HanRHA438_Chr10g0446271 [Helianthus annuus]
MLSFTIEVIYRSEAEWEGYARSFDYDEAHRLQRRQQVDRLTGLGDDFLYLIFSRLDFLELTSIRGTWSVSIFCFRQRVHTGISQGSGS